MTARRKIKLSAAEMEATIIAILERSVSPITAYTIQDRAAANGVQLYPTQVYRTMARLTAAGKVTRVESVNAFLLTPMASNAIAICAGCGRAYPLEAREPIDAIKRLFAETGFDVSALVVEAQGRCRGCSVRNEG